MTLWTSYSSFLFLFVSSSLPQLTIATLQFKPQLFLTTTSLLRNSPLYSQLSDEVIISQQSFPSPPRNHPSSSTHHKATTWNDLYPTFAENSRTVSHICLTGTLSSISKSNEIDGSPYGSSVDFITDEKGWPVLLLSDRSEHSQNIQANPQVSLSCQLSTSQDYGEQPSDLGQVTIVGEVIPIPSGREAMLLEHAFTLAHPRAEPFVHSSKHSFQKIKPLKIRYTGGYVSSWINLTEYEQATPDSVATEMPKLLPRLNLEKKTELKLVCKHFLRLKNPMSVKICSMDRLGFDLRIKIEKSAFTTQEYRVNFRHRVATIEDAKSELLKLFHEVWQREHQRQRLQYLPVTLKYQPREAMVS